MTVPDVSSQEQRVLLVAPTASDAENTCALLTKANICCVDCRDLAHLAKEITRGVGAIILTDRALFEPSIESVFGALDAQPAWSDIPVVILTRAHPHAGVASRALNRFRNVTLLDRPTSTRTMVSAVSAALRARSRQYELRAQLELQRASEEALRDADRRKDEFLATLAHELRNPLAPLLTGLHLLDSSTLDSGRMQRVRAMMTRQVTQLVKLIDDLLEVSRIATGKVVLKPERIDLRSVVEAAIESTQPTLTAASHRLKIELPPDPVMADADPSRLEQVICNLLNNACKYTPSGGNITVRLERANTNAELQVIDDGLGIPRDMLPLVFDLFTQVDRNLERAQGGLGIGLSLVKRLMELHGGEVRAESAGPDRGSTFTLTLPLASVDHPDTMLQLPTEKAAEVKNRLRILVVDDNKDAAESLSMLLTMQGHISETVYSGLSALKVVDEFRPQIVFCDLGMPGMSGHEVARALRQKHLGCVLVALTGWGAEEDKRKTRESGFDTHVTKPISLADVERIVSAHPVSSGTF